MHILNLEKFHQNRRARLGLVYLTFLVILIHLPITVNILFQSDYVAHAYFSESIRLYGDFQFESDAQTITYPLYHFVTNALITLQGQNSQIESYGSALSTGIVVTFIFRIMTAYIIYIAMCLVAPNRVMMRSMIFYVLLTVGLLIFAPLFLFNLEGIRLLPGYIYANMYHNPSTLVVIPFGLLVFFASMSIFSDKDISMSFTITSMILAAITVLAKPSFTIGFVPALILAIIIQRLRGQTIQWRYALAILIPSTLAVAGQFFLTFVFGASEGSITLYPFYLPLIQNGSYIMIFAKALVSLVFPILVITLYRDVLKENMILLSWLFLIVAVSYDWLLLEEGIRMGHRNFQWTVIIANFILFTVHMLYLIKYHSREMLYEKWTWKLRLILGVFTLHVIFGIYFYALQIINSPFNDIF